MPQTKGMAKAGKLKSVKKTGAAVERTDAGGSSGSAIPLHLQQDCLNIFRRALEPDAQNAQTVQEVKGHLYNRNFASAFGKEEYLRVYAARWSPSRALGYLQVLTDIQEHVRDDRKSESFDEPSKGAGLRVVCLGGGAGAELVALAGWIKATQEITLCNSIDASMIDIADWSSTVSDLHSAVVTPPELSKYASTAAKESNQAVLAETAFKVAFLQRDALAWPESEIPTAVGTAHLVTLMFTLNELYSTSMQKTQRLLTHLTSAMLQDALLLVVDSPGSYSTVSINGAEKRYPMQWLLDLTLLGPPAKAEGKQGQPKWMELVSDESRWFRLPQGLQYPIELENMRYQIHLYRRLGKGEAGE